MKSPILLLGALAASVLAVPAPHDYTVHERRSEMPSSWSQAKRVHQSISLPMRIGLTQSNLDRGHDLLMEVSDPSSSRYGKHYTAQEVHDLFAPSQDAVDSVRSWLEESGIAAHRISQSFNKQWLQFDADVDEAEKLLETEYYIYSQEDTGKSHIACREYHVPRSVQDHIDYVTPGIKGLGVREPKPAKKRDLAARGILPPILGPLTIPLSELLGNELAFCDIAITPACIKAMYNISEGTTATKGNELGIFEDLGDIYAQEDLDLFFSNLASNIPKGTKPTLKAIDGATAPANILNAGPESDLDFQISYPIIWPQNSILFQTDDNKYQSNYVFDGFLNNFLDAIDGSYCTYSAYGETGNSPLDPPYPNPAPGGYKGQLMCGEYKPTNVISISYGGSESDLPISYQRRQCNEWMKLGMQGISAVVASGDSGVASADNTCLGKDGKVFVPEFPATCPYMTSVGGTYLPVGADVKKNQEVATESFKSGGGFSNIYETADYQKKAVSDYFATTNVPYKSYSSVDNSSFAQGGGIYNRNGRGYPDVSAIADNILIFNKGLSTVIGGTSAAAPVFASLLTRINEERIAANKSTVGFVNPVLYANPDVFTDVTSGNNAGCGTDGFPSSKGWDPVTGLGTPNYPKLLDLFMKQD
ncbi:hypothetical protein ASPWEDRAFT_121564 [Aspergillus wentii DTO 134E9]|uniref:Peptidase S53 domain-containing protein n=1 Tax=Aspergillus wentii DTO 134E9 TaxID=1073089 RepID=A0A1L9R5Q0_ASPWE|nr:uncharacterized protein ASPWEDRAFT_121564 [Aspergillus wentii DTO 134E9]KAI9925294.1 Tripeptidyl-peptidase sed1 [Aspergillus wentii]OJJ30208.1 hypothetical protein ASPWEDRAFT_121564 [Aspergillus wentii DTO 134E9]